jgi:zinc transport system substrate-binding protein
MFAMPVRSVLIFFILMFSLPLQIMAEGKLTVYTTNYPLTYFAERIGGDHITVFFPVPSDVDPAFWLPDAVTVRKYQKADLIILNGAGYEKWTRKVSLPMLRMVDTSKTFKDNLIHIETNVTHSHGPGGDHSHGGTAFTTWLDFSQAAAQAEAIYKALSRKMPVLKADFVKNFESLKKDLLALDAQMTALSAKKPGLPLVGSHPIYQYMARRYNLNLKMVMWEPGEDPGKQKWNQFRELVKEHPAEWMIWEGKPLPESAKRLQEMNIRSRIFSPCFSKPEQGDFLSVMQQNIKNMGKVF